LFKISALKDELHLQITNFLIEILYQDEYIVAINKPYGYFVHKSSLDATSDKIIMYLLRDHLGQKVYPAHRLDRKTSGVLLFALDEATHKALSIDFQERKIEKKYQAIVRGHTPITSTITYPLIDEKGRERDAITHFTTLKHGEIPLSSNPKFKTSRYSLIDINPETGRMHQIRRHMSHIFHPIIGDRPHGCNKQNRFFLEQFNFSEMLLHANTLKLCHPVDNNDILISAPYSPEFQRMLTLIF
jgi:tRNA pseudouridine65 synthase